MRAQPLGQHKRVVQAGVGQQQRKLFAPDAPDHVDLARHLLHQRRQVPEHRVAGRVAPGVVDLLEVVDVDRHDGAGALRVAPLALELLAQPGHETAPVGRPGQVVGGSQQAQFLGQPHALGDVLEDRVDAVQHAGLEQRRGRDAHPDHAAFGFV